MVAARGRLDEPMVERALWGGSGPPDILEVLMTFEEQPGVEQGRRPPDLLRRSLGMGGAQQPDGDRGPGGLPAKVREEWTKRRGKGHVIAIRASRLLE